MTRRPRPFLPFALLLAPLLFLSGYGLAAEPPLSVKTDDTALLFVGEKLDVLSIASRREESAAQAPAVARVVSRREFREWGSVTLSQVLERVPGFYMAEKEFGTMPYLRGLPNAILFLYDTVPLGSELSKALHPLDHELSLAPVKRVEIVRGPASVLWGPDAFAGVVNVVPLTGKDIQGVKAEALYQEPGDHKGASLSLGKHDAPWDGFLSFSARTGEEDDTRVNIVRFWGDLDDTPVSPEDRRGGRTPGRAHYLDFYGRLSYGDDLVLSGRFSDNEKPYALSSVDGKNTWRENRKLPFGYLKLDARKNWGLETVLRFSSFYSRLEPEFEVIDRTLKQEEETLYGEALFERTLWTGRGLLTGGVSLKRKDVEDAPVWDSYFPDFLGPDNVSFLPGVSLQNFDSTLWSVFGQYMHKMGDLDFMVGLRHDVHNEFDDHLSFSAGIVWSPADAWVFKLLYGTSYRTPFARQLLEEDESDLEKAENTSLEVAWSPNDRASIGVTGFFNRISHHIMEDPYAGLSEPNRQEILGVELEGRFKPLKTLEAFANLTLLDNSGPDETYRFTEFSFVTPDGEVVEEITELRYPFDTGPEGLFNSGVHWRPNRRFSAFGGLRYFSTRKLIHPRGEATQEVPETWLVDLNATVKDIGKRNLDLTLTVRNLLDDDYETPGTFSLIDGEPFSAQAVIRYRW